VAGTLVSALSAGTRSTTPIRRLHDRDDAQGFAELGDLHAGIDDAVYDLDELLETATPATTARRYRLTDVARVAVSRRRGFAEAGEGGGGVRQLVVGVQAARVGETHTHPGPATLLRSPTVASGAANAVR
jgi:hypothetical protein